MLTSAPFDAGPCPACQQGTGIPVSVTMGNGQRVVSLRCSSCEQRWTVSDASANPRHMNFPPSDLSRS